jgi:hypothetical protein
VLCPGGVPKIVGVKEKGINKKHIYWEKKDLNK